MGVNTPVKYGYVQMLSAECMMGFTLRHEHISVLNITSDSVILHWHLGIGRHIGFPAIQFKFNCVSQLIMNMK